MNNSSDLFKKNIDKAYSQIKVNSSTMKDASGYKDSFKEEMEQIKKKKKTETKEVTSTSSAGQFSGPKAFADSEFLRKSQEETKKVEAKEATTSSSVGAYSTPAFVAPNKKNWRGAKKPLYKGGKFVQIKRKCLTFPYCNKGDIGALKLKEGSNLDLAIKEVAKKLSINEEVIKNIIIAELKNLNNLDIYNKTKK